MTPGSGDGYGALFKRLPKHFEYMAFEFRELVQKEDPIVGQGDFAGAGRITAPHQSRIGNGVVRSAKGPDVPHRCLLAAQGMKRSSFERFCVGKRRKQASKSACQHAFARTGRAGHQEMVLTGCGNFQRAPCSNLSLYKTTFIKTC